MSKLMVVGIIIANSQVLLIKKNVPKGYKGVGRPTDQNGLLNGIGGVVLNNETAIECLIRKTKAECGLSTVANQWIPFHEIQSADGTRVLFAKCAMPPAQITKATSPTDESVQLINIDKLGAYTTMANIPWLVSMARDNSHSYSISEDNSNGRVSQDNEVALTNTAWTTMGTTAPAGAASTATAAAGASTTIAGTTAAPAPESKANEGSENNAGGSISGNSSDTTSTASTGASADSAPAAETTASGTASTGASTAAAGASTDTTKKADTTASTGK